MTLTERVAQMLERRRMLSCPPCGCYVGNCRIAREMAATIVTVVAEEMSAENAKLRLVLMDIASAQMLWHGGVGPRSRFQLNDFISQLQEMASTALKEIKPT